jgi:hypothetical protein
VVELFLSMTQSAANVSIGIRKEFRHGNFKYKGITPM